MISGRTGGAGVALVETFREVGEVEGGVDVSMSFFVPLAIDKSAVFFVESNWDAEIFVVLENVALERVVVR